MKYFFQVFISLFTQAPWWAYILILGIFFGFLWIIRDTQIAIMATVSIVFAMALIITVLWTVIHPIFYNF